MTYEEAIETIKITKAEVEWDYPLDYCEAFNMAIEALAMQIPKKVTFITTRIWGVESKQPVCPVCDYFLTKTGFFGDFGDGEKITYCDHCGNAIDWRGDNK